jgi:type II secretory pathway predicted ATPase ExeA
MTVTTHHSAPLARALSNLPQGPEKKREDRVYLDFYNLKGTPFAITPDPEFLFLSETHRNVLEKLQYAIETRMGFMLLTGEAGTGKTTLCRTLLDQMQDGPQTVYVINPALSGHELLANIMDDLGIACPAQASKKELIDRLNRFLLTNEAAGPVVIIVDDAQNMPLTTMEDLRLLSNLETDKTRLLQTLLVGQPELLQLLDRPEIRQLKQRVAIHCRLDFLSRAEVGDYIERRLFVAGNQGQIRFTPKVVKQIHKRSGGVPRIINKISDLTLTAAYTANCHTVQSIHFKADCSELIEDRGRWPRFCSAWQSRLQVALIAVVAVLAVLAAEYGTRVHLYSKLFSRQVRESTVDSPSFAEAFSSSRGSFAGYVFPEGPQPSAATLDRRSLSLEPEMSTRFGY